MDSLRQSDEDLAHGSGRRETTESRRVRRVKGDARQPTVVSERPFAARNEDQAVALVFV